MEDTNEERSEAVKNRENKKDSRRYNIGICVFSVLNVLLVTMIVVAGYYICSEIRVIVKYDVDICVPCAEMKLHPDDIIEGIERRGENKTVCCMVEENGPNAIFENYIDHWLKKKLAAEDRGFIRYKCDNGNRSEPQKPIIKLVGKSKKQSAKHHKVHWDGDNEMAIVPEDGSITYHKKHGFIEIKESGLYQVYSQIVLDHDMSLHNPNKGPDIYFHKIIQMKANAIHREILLSKTTNSHCVSEENRQTITSYIGAVFHLSQGDRMAVKVHNITELVPVPHMNVFGAYMLALDARNLNKFEMVPLNRTSLYV